MSVANFSNHEYNRRRYLVRNGKASFWSPYKSVDAALKGAGLLADTKGTTARDVDYVW